MTKTSQLLQHPGLKGEGEETRACLRVDAMEEGPLCKSSAVEGCSSVKTTEWQEGEEGVDTFLSLSCPIS